MFVGLVVLNVLAHVTAHRVLTRLEGRASVRLAAFVNVCVKVSVCLAGYVCESTRVFWWVCACMYACVWVCVCVRVRVCLVRSVYEYVFFVKCVSDNM